MVVGGAVRKVFDEWEHAADAFGRLLAAEVLANFFEADTGAFAYLLRNVFVCKRIHLDEVDAEIDCRLAEFDFFDRRDERDAEAAAACTCGTSAAMHIDFVVGGVVIDENVRHVIDVDAACGNIGADENLEFLVAEGVERLFAEALGHVAAECADFKTVAGKHLFQVAHVALVVAENHAAFGIVVFQNLDGHGIFFHHVTSVIAVFKVVCNDLVVAERKEFGTRTLEFAGEALDRLRNRRTVHRARDGLRQVLADFLHVGVESHRKHFVGFVKHEVSDGEQIDIAALDVVHQTARGCNNHMNASTERLDLRFVVHAAKNRNGLDASTFREFFKFFLHLDAEFSRRHKDKRLRVRMVTDDDLQKGKRVCTGLSRTGLRLHEHIASGEHVRDGLALDGHEFSPAVLPENSLLFFGEHIKRIIGELVLGLDNFDRR